MITHILANTKYAERPLEQKYMNIKIKISKIYPVRYQKWMNLLLILLHKEFIMFFSFLMSLSSLMSQLEYLSSRAKLEFFAH